MKRSHSKVTGSSIAQAHKTSRSGAKLIDVPQDVVRHVILGKQCYSNPAGFLTADEQVHLGFSSQNMFHVTSQSRDARTLQKFLLCVAHGEQDKAEGLLKIAYGTPSKWLINAGEFTDYSGRTFHCTAYEYAYWAKDTHMCRMLGQYMDETTKASMLQRINEMERIDAITGQEIGLTYQQHGTTHRSAHFDFSPLKKAMQAYVEGYDRWYAAYIWSALGNAWMEVGKAQRDVPAHVAQEYCYPERAFYPCPKFNEPKLPRNTLKFFKNTGEYRIYSWFPLDNSNTGLGVNCALLRGGFEGWVMGIYCTDSRHRIWGPCPDLEAITRLDEVRTAELAQLRENLNPLAVQNVLQER